LLTDLQYLLTKSCAHCY